MHKYRIGRFVIDVPEMSETAAFGKLRYSAVEDFVWPKDVDKRKARQLVWEKRITEIKNLTPPRGKQDVVISTNELPGIGEWSRGVYYFGSYMDDEVANYDVLVDFGKVGLWIKCDSALWNAGNEMKIFRNANNIASSFFPIDLAQTSQPPEHAYYLKFGVLKLPYLRQEKTYARFEGHPLKLKLQVEMNETHEVESLSMAERLAASVATRYAPGVEVAKIRSHTRVAAGLKGEELVTRMSASGEDTQIQFCWEYRGEVDSGERPEIQITMETPDGNLDEKLRVWDGILDSFKPVYVSR